MRNKITIGSRESRLAVIQSEMVRDYLTNRNPGLEVQILTMKTTGDKILDQALEKIGGKGLFVKELDRALLEGRSDISVHSLKDACGTAADRVFKAGGSAGCPCSSERKDRDRFCEADRLFEQAEDDPAAGAVSAGGI